MGGKEDTGSLSVGQRMTRIEDRQDESDKAMLDHVAQLWTKINQIQIEIAQSNTKLAIVVGILCFIASFGAQLALKKFGG